MGWTAARVGLELVTDDREAQPEIVECSLIDGIQ
jgi:hypothetical protein